MSDADPRASFWTEHYLRHDMRRLEHLASLGFDFAGRSVLELGAGIGDLTSFFVDRGARVVTTEGDPANAAILAERHPDLDVRVIDLEDPERAAALVPEVFDVVFCYGLLYHLGDPSSALDLCAARARELLLVETCVSPEAGDVLRVHAEPPAPENALHGRGCRPSRRWLFRELAARMPHVYCPRTQPAHEEFPLDWTVPVADPWLTRATFVASRAPLDSPHLAPTLLDTQRRA